MEKILVIEDDDSIRSELKTLLRANGYQPVDCQPCDLVLLDINLPGENGFQICQKLRQTSDVPVIFLTARDSREDELLGFGTGGDDFIRKPYDSSILLASIGRLLKRKDRSSLTAKGLTLSLGKLTAQYGERKTELTRNETRILTCLMQRKMCTREEIIEELWNNSLYIDDNTLGINISRLREKLKNLGADDYIHTVRGVGYRI